MQTFISWFDRTAVDIIIFCLGWFGNDVYQWVKTKIPAAKTTTATTSATTASTTVA